MQSQAPLTHLRSRRQRLYLKDNRREPNIWCFSPQSSVLERILHISSESQHTSNIRQKCSEKIFAAGEVIKDCTEWSVDHKDGVYAENDTTEGYFPNFDTRPIHWVKDYAALKR